MSINELPTHLADRLESWAQNEESISTNVMTEHGHDCVDTARTLRRLVDLCNTQAMILRRLAPDKFPNTYFIHGEAGSKDNNGMPEKILVVPAYGVDFSYVYQRTDMTTGPEW